MLVEYWAVGASLSAFIQMTPSDISAHLANDWLPSLPADIGASLMGWPHHLLTPTYFQGRQVLALRDELGGTERQWKGVMSWMLGVAGTRHILKSERYRWIAPVSAFYESNIQNVNIYGWHPSIPQTALRAERRSTGTMAPDYLALRSTSLSELEHLEWAVVEAKGNQACLTKKHNCPSDWSKQVRNITLSMGEVPIDIQRHLVVATRVNPNARRIRGRRIQVRAWNSKLESEIQVLPPQGAVEIAASHLFGLFRNLRLLENARAIALSLKAGRLQQNASPEGLRDIDSREIESVLRKARNEIMERGDNIRTNRIEEGRATVIRVETAYGVVNAALAAPIIDFARNIWDSKNVGNAFGVLRDLDAQLDRWIEEPSQKESGKIALPCGVQFSFPETFESQGL